MIESWSASLPQLSTTRNSPKSLRSEANSSATVLLAKTTIQVLGEYQFHATSPVGTASERRCRALIDVISMSRCIVLPTVLYTQESSCHNVLMRLGRGKKFRIMISGEHCFLQLFSPCMGQFMDTSALAGGIKTGNRKASPTSGRIVRLSGQTIAERKERRYTEPLAQLYQGRKNAP